MSVHVVKGSDPLLRGDALERLVNEVLEGDDRTLALEEFTIPNARAGDGDGDERAGGDADAPGVVAAILNAAQSPPFMTARRVVVVRDYEQLAAADAAVLAEYIADPLESTVLVLMSGGGRVVKVLADALKEAGAATVGPGSEKTVDVLTGALTDAGLALQPDALTMVAGHLGDDAGRVGGLVEVLASAYGRDATLEVGDVEPYLGEEGSVPAYQLTNRIEEGDVAGAVATLHRLITVTSVRDPKPRHPLQIMGLLHARVGRLLRLDDPTIRTVDDAHAALGGKGSTFPSRKALEASRALGTDGLRRAVDHLHRADLDLKGATGLPPETVIEVLVARLAGLSSRGRRGQPARPRRASR